MLYFANWKILLICAICALGVLLSAPNLFSRSLLAGCRMWCRTSRWRSGSICAAAPICCSGRCRGGAARAPRIRSSTMSAMRCSTPISAIPASRSKAMRSCSRSANRAGSTMPGRRWPRSIPDLTVAIDARRRGQVDSARPRPRRSGSQAVDQSIEIIRRRIDETGTKEPTIERQGAGPDRWSSCPASSDPEHVKDADRPHRQADLPDGRRACHARRGAQRPSAAGDEMLPARASSNSRGPTPMSCAGGSWSAATC